MSYGYGGKQCGTNECGSELLFFFLLLVILFMPYGAYMGDELLFFFLILVVLFLPYCTGGFLGYGATQVKE